MNNSKSIYLIATRFDVLDMALSVYKEPKVLQSILYRNRNRICSNFKRKRRRIDGEQFIHIFFISQIEISLFYLQQTISDMQLILFVKKKLYNRQRLHKLQIQQ